MSTQLRRALGIFMTAIGLLWVGQGLGWIGGSVMTGDLLWVVVGGVVAVIGLGLALGGRRADPR